jgi:hypothetical protein
MKKLLFGLMFAVTSVMADGIAIGDAVVSSGTFVFDDYVIRTPTYKCKKHGKLDGNSVFVIYENGNSAFANHEKENSSYYCLYCVKKFLDRKLGQVKEIK